MVNNMSIGEIFDIELIVADTISAIAASMGVIFTVPITAAVYALFNRNVEHDKVKTNENERNLKL